MRVGIVGSGMIFGYHMEAYRRIGLRVTGVVDIDHSRAAKAAAEHQIPFVTTDWRELVGRAEVDLVDVCTPPKFHREVVVGALQAGKHVVCEKPLAPSLPEIDAIQRAEEQAIGRLAVLHQRRFDPAYHRLKWLIDSGELGRICFACNTIYDPLPPRLVEQSVWGCWDLAGGGVLMTKAIHDLDLLLWYLGDAKCVHARMGTFLSPIESEDHALAIIEFEGEALVSFSISGNPCGYVTRLDVVGDRGTVFHPWDLRLTDPARQKEVEAKLASLGLLPEAGGKGGWSAPMRRVASKIGRRVARKLGSAREPQPPETLHTAFLREVVEAMHGTRDVPVSSHDARKAIELCTAIYTSALTGERVELPLDPSARFYEGVHKDDYKFTGSPQV